MAKKQQPQLPAWVWLFTGVVTGLFAAFLVYLANIKGTPAELSRMESRPSSVATATASRTQTKQESTRASTSNTTPEKERKFEFYTLLPEAETMGPPAAGDAKKATATTAKTDEKKPEPLKQRTLLQTGSFQRVEDAEKQRAQLILLGLPASIQKVDIRTGETWHRVQAGPFTDASSLSRAQKSLTDSRIQHIVIRLKSS